MQEDCICIDLRISCENLAGSENHIRYRNQLHARYAASQDCNCKVRFLDGFCGI